MVAPTVLIIILPSVVPWTITTVAVPLTATCFSQSVRLSIAPVEVAAMLAVGRSTRPPIPMDEGEVLHRGHMREDTIGQAMLDVGRGIMMACN
jgi:hypothetical protein